MGCSRMMFILQVNANSDDNDNDGGSGGNDENDNSDDRYIIEHIHPKPTTLLGTMF